MKTIHNVKIDLLTPGLHPRVYAVQDDICTREVQISLYSGSVSWTPTSGACVAVGYRKSDGTVGIYDTLPDGSSAVSISGNVVTVILAAQMLTAAGTVEAAVTLAEKSGNQITTFAFDVIVSANPGSGAIKSEDYFNYVNPKIQAVIEQAATATTAANTAASRANASAELAEDAYDLADTANQKVDTLQEVVSKFHSNIQETVRGEVITVSDASDLPLAGLKVFGKTEQNGIPTPDAPVALESVGESVNVTVCGKALIPNLTTSRTTNGITFTVNDDKSVLVNGTCVNSDTYFNHGYATIPAGTYILSGSPSGSKVGNLDMYVVRRNPIDNTSYGVIARCADDTTQNTFTLPEASTIEIIIRVKNGRVVDNAIFYPMVRLASITDDTYEPYKEQLLAIPTPNGLPGIPVTSGGNYTDENGQQWVCDEMDFEKGQYIQRIYSYTFTGQETINSFDSGKTLGRDIKLLGLPSCIVPKKASGSNVSPILCTHEAVTTHNALKNDSGGIAVAVWGNTQYLYFSGTYYGDANGLKTAMAEAYANGTPYVWMYALETPIIRELTEAEKVDYTALHTNYPNTTVFNDGGAGMEVKYVADTKLYIDKKFAELSAALLNQ